MNSLPPNIGWVIGGHLIAIFIIGAIRSWLRLRHIPGPFSARFSRLWLLRHSLGGRLALVTAEGAEKYGSLFRVGPNELVSNDPEVWRKILGVRTQYRRSDWFESARFDQDRHSIVTERNNKAHSKLRIKLSAGYSGKEIESLELAIDDTIAKFVQFFESKYLSTDEVFKPVDFGIKAQYYTLDALSSVAFGKPFGDLDQDEDCFSYIHTTDKHLPLIALAGIFPWLIQIIRSPLVRKVIPTDADAMGLGKVVGFARETVAERFGPNKKVIKDMLGSFIRHGLTQTEAEGESLVQIFAGSETTATAIRATLLYIITNPPVYNTLLAEISSNPISNPITDSEARTLVYLQAIIREGLRMFPPAPILSFRQVPKGGDTISGYFVPENTKIGYNMFGLTRDPKLWGEDAKIFRPERWLNRTLEETRKMEANVDLVFGYGKWQCLGKNLAQMELNKIFVQLLRNFEITIVNPEQPWKAYNASVFILMEMWIRVKKRDPPL